MFVLQLGGLMRNLEQNERIKTFPGFPGAAMDGHPVELGAKNLPEICWINRKRLQSLLCPSAPRLHVNVHVTLAPLQWQKAQKRLQFGPKFNPVVNPLKGGDRLGDEALDADLRGGNLRGGRKTGRDFNCCSKGRL